MGRRLALVVGNSRYNDPGLSALVAPDVDVRELGNALRSSDVGQFDEVVQLVNEPSPAVRRAIAELFHHKRREDLVLLYFSGHGIRDEAGQLYLATRDTERNLLAATAVEASFITNQMDRSASRRQVLILDCCHSGAFGAKNALGASVGTGSAFAGIGYGRVVLTATDATQYAWEGERVIGDAEPSIFTNFLVLGIQSGAADLNGDGEITIDELYEYAYDEVVNSSSKQVPGKWAFKQQGEIVIARSPRGERIADLPEALLAKIASPSVSIQLDAIRNLEVMVRGRHRGRAAAARLALRQLEASTAPVVAEAARAVVAATAGDSSTSGIPEQPPARDPVARGARPRQRITRRLAATLAPRAARYVLLAASVLAALAIWSLDRDIAGMFDVPPPPAREASTAPTTGTRVPDPVGAPVAGPLAEPEPPGAPATEAARETGTNTSPATGQPRTTPAPERSGSRRSGSADGRGRSRSGASFGPRDDAPSVEKDRGVKAPEPAAAGTTTSAEAGAGSRDRAGTSAAADRSAIVDLLERYRKAYNSKNLAAIKQIFPSVPSNLFGRGMKDCASFDLQFARPTVDFLSDGTVLVQTLSTYRCNPTSRRPPVTEPPVTDTFIFERAGGSWVIKDHRVSRGT